MKYMVIFTTGDRILLGEEVGRDLLVQFVEGRVNHPESDLFIHLESGIYLSRSKVVCITPTDWFVQRTPKEASLGAA